MRADEQELLADAMPRIIRADQVRVGDVVAYVYRPITAVRPEGSVRVMIREGGSHDYYNNEKQFYLLRRPVPPSRVTGERT